MSSGAEDTGEQNEREQANAIMVGFNRDAQGENRRTSPRAIEHRSHFGLLEGLLVLKEIAGRFPRGPTEDNGHQTPQ